IITARRLRIRITTTVAMRLDLPIRKQTRSTSKTTKSLWMKTPTMRTPTMRAKTMARSDSMSGCGRRNLESTSHSRTKVFNDYACKLS
ncbi:hypothetical protein PMIN06_003837, partial [Paraphaeosphaeria minitans]